MSSPMSNKAPATRSGTGNHQPPVVRQLKPPPEIWELVHPVTTAKPKPIRSFLSRMVSSWAVLVCLAFVVGIGAGVGLALWKHPAAKAFFANQQKPVEATQQQPVVTNAAPAPVQPSSTSADNSTAPPAASTETQPTATTTAPEVAASSEAQPAATESSSRPVVRRSTLPRQPRTPDAALGVRVGSPSSASSERPESAKSPERNPTDSAATKPKSNTDSQVITPVKPAPASKPKVIPWP
jgi:hypothetical protein